MTIGPNVNSRGSIVGGSIIGDQLSGAQLSGINCRGLNCRGTVRFMYHIPYVVCGSI